MIPVRSCCSTRDVLAWFWPFAREEPHGHPPFYALLGLVGDVVAPSWRDLPRARLGPILLFSLTAGAIFDFAAARWGGWAAALAAGSWVLQPNLFGHGHYAAYDAVIASLWVLAIIAFAQAVIPGRPSRSKAARWSWIVVFGLILGCAAATKLTGWFLPLPFLAWAAWYRDRRAFAMLLVGMAIAGVVIFALVPPWWSDPIGGVMRFLRLEPDPRARPNPIKVEFLGNVYDTPRESLPWYNTIVWTVLVTPVGFLALGMLGAASAVARRRTEPIGLLIAGHWAFLMILRALPHTPGHDGVRLFLPAFGMLALLGGLGARALLERSARWGRAAIVAALVEGIVSVAVMMPVPLSYFSPIVGGLPGATALGMEPTYYWDALSPDARRWLAEHTPPGQTFFFATQPDVVALSAPDGRAAAAALRPEGRGPVPVVRRSEPPGRLLRSGSGPRRAGQGRLRRHQAGRAAGLDLPLCGMPAPGSAAKAGEPVGLTPDRTDPVRRMHAVRSAQPLSRPARPDR